MTPESQRLALAKWAGFKMCPVHLAYECCGNRVPDFLHDLNAVAQLEEKLSPEQAYGNLRNLCKDHKKWLDGSAYLIIAYATAAQRCEALLRTLGLWEE